MTAPRDPDDLASALLDGLLTDDEAAVARRNPAVVARLAELAAVREVVRRAPPGPDPVARERGLAAALAAFEAGDDAAEQRGAGAVGSTVGAGDRRRPAKRPAAARAGTPWRPRATAGRRWLTAAAVVLAVVGLGVLASNWDAGSDNADTAAQGGETTGDSDDAGSGSGSATVEEPEGGTAEQGAAPTVAPGGIVDLGDVDSSLALAERARSALAAGSSSPLSEAAGDQDAAEEGAGGGALRSQCAGAAGAARLPATGETIVLEARATLDGDSVDVWVLAADGTERVVAIDTTCEVVVDRPLD
jgi:hypothetical protein